MRKKSGMLKVAIVSAIFLLTGLAVVNAFSRHTTSSFSTVPQSATASTESPSGESLSGNVIQTSVSETSPGFLTYDDAIADARHSNKLVLIDFYTDWCGWCKRMDKDVYADPKVQELLQKYFSATKMNAESAEEHQFGGRTLSQSGIAGSIGVDSYPTIVFLTPDQQLVKELPGYVPAAQFAQILTYMGTGAYKTQEFKEWQAHYKS